MDTAIESILGVRIREYRSRRKLRLEDLAHRTGLSKSFLSRLENGKVSPSIPNLSRIARALNVTMADLLHALEEEAETSLVIVRNEKRRITVRGDTEFGYTYEALASGLRYSIIEPFVIRHPPGLRHSQLFTHEGYEFNYILEGELELIYGDKSVVLREGDSVYYDASVPHRGLGNGPEETVVLAINVRLPW